MDSQQIDEIKQSLKQSLHKYVGKFDYTSLHPLDLLIPKERKIRSVVGGLETSMGTTVWEPIAKTLAASNGFEVLSEKILKPEPMPLELASELSTLISLRETSSTWVSTEECRRRFREVCRQLDSSEVTYIAPPSGTGVDILLKKDEHVYAFDTKTVWPNLSNMKSFNKEILEWYAYAIYKNPDVEINCMIAYPYNPHPKNFWTYTPHNLGILEPHVDAVEENEFWDFISGVNNTYQIILDIFSELGREGFGEELSRMIEQIHSPLED